MASFVNKYFEPVKMLGKTLIGAVSMICKTKCHSLRKEIKVDEVFIPRWEDSSYCSLAREWDGFTGLCENWNLKLKWAEPLESSMKTINETKPWPWGNPRWVGHGGEI